MANHGSAKQRVETPHSADSTENSYKVEALAGIICGAGEEPAIALLILMAMLENSDDPTVLANTVKHLAFTRCGELNVFGIVDSQMELLADKLLSPNTLPS